MPAPDLEPDVVPRSDADVILAVRAGEVAAIDELYRRHRGAAEAFAESLAGRTLAPDLVSEAFVRIIDLLKRGGGPTAVFRSYLYTTVRNLYVDHIRRHSRQTSLPDFGPLENEFALSDGLDERFEHSVVRSAFRTLPERWQIALWYTTVEGVSLHEAGKHLGVAPNAVAALTFRAREGLRQAYLAEHLKRDADPECAEVWDVLPRYVRGSLRGKPRRQVEDHLPTCRRCTEAAAELTGVNSSLRGLLLLALLGAGTAGCLDRALGTGASAGAEPSGVVGGGTSRGVRVVAALGAAATVGAVALAWPDQHHDDQRRAPEPTSTTTRAATPPTVAPASPRVVLGSVSWSRVTAAGPAWYHLTVPVAAPSDELTLVVRASSWRGFRVHREAGYGAWRCRERSTDGTARQLECHLREGATGSYDLGLDLQTDKKVTVVITASTAGEASRISTVVGD